MSQIYLARSEAWALGWLIYFSAITLSELASATEQESVAVSKSKIYLSIVYSVLAVTVELSLRSLLMAVYGATTIEQVSERPLVTSMLVMS